MFASCFAALAPLLSLAAPAQGAPSPFPLASVPDSAPRALRALFRRHVDVFGVSIYVTPEAARRPGYVQHAAHVLAEYLDNDEDGRVDDPALLEAMLEAHAALIVCATERELERIAPRLFRSLPDDWVLQDLYLSEVHPLLAEGGRPFDATLEEVLHLVTHAGLARAYPEAFGEGPGTLLSEAMDVARGGHFERVPDAYPEGAWYSYDDETCDYECMAAEYVYWALTSLLGAQREPWRAREIAHEWRLATPDAVTAGDPAVADLLTDPQYNLPTVLPDGSYRGAVPDYEAAAPGTARSAPPSIFQWLDRDADGVVGPYEGADAMLLLTRVADEDGDGALSAAELTTFLEDEVLAGEAGFDPRAELEADARGFFAELDDDRDGVVGLSDLAPGERAEVAEHDLDGDLRLTLDELLDFVAAELEGARFKVEGTRARMSGTIGPTTPGRVLALLLEHPEVETLVLTDVPGSMDDEANLRAARYVRRAGLHTALLPDSEVASGGVDFFLAGVRREVPEGARVGVHSWGGGPVRALDLPLDAEEHDLYLDFYRAMDVPEDFYWFTLEAAPAEGIHWMTRDEIEHYALSR